MMDFLRAVSQNPELMRSKTHQIDVGEMLRSVATATRIPNSSRFILPPPGDDARISQGEEIELMQKGEYVEPQQAEDHQIHAAVCKEEELRWKAVMDQPEAQWIEKLLIPHRMMHEQMAASAQMMQQAQAQQSAVSTAGGTMPNATASGTPGQMMGQEASGAMGPIAGEA
jgi:hypothetical protein